jgi:hypothetical protein
LAEQETLIRLRARSTVTVAAIGMTQTLAWGSSYYLPAILTDPIAAGLGVPKSLFFGFFSGSLLLQAALGPIIGKAIDRHGGRGQVAARLFEFGVLKRLHPLVSARRAVSLHPLGAAELVVFGGSAASAFALLHGAGNGLLTISRGTLPLAMFGPAGCGLRTGIIAAPAPVTTVAAPLLFGLLLNVMGMGALLVSGGLSLAAPASLALLRVQPAEAAS